ncbi:MAG: hypothetical protein V3T05_05935 [Myxococcota bacterium]
MGVPRWLWIPCGLQVVLAAVLCFVPLFDLLGYEFSFAIGMLAAVTATLIGLGAGRDAPSAPRALGDAIKWSLLHLAPPLVIMTLNALRVRNCDIMEGIGFFLLLPVMSALYAAAMATAVARVLIGARRRVWVSVTIVLLAAPMIWTLWHLYWEPPIFAYDHLWGHFAGSLYDEVVELGTTLVVFRIGTLWRILGIAVLLVLWEGRVAVSGVRLAAATAFVVLVTTAFELEAGPRFGFRVSRGDIEAVLPAVVKRAGLVIHLPEHVDEKRREAIADEHAFRLAQLERRLEIEVPRTIHSYVYRDANQKARLMGGRATMIAKPWLFEIHVHGLSTPHPVVAHELVHVVAATFGSQLLGVSSRYGLVVNMALVEGAAVALSPERGDLDLDSWARAMRELGMAPEVRELFGPGGFWTQAPRRAYTVAGSFVRHLLATHGAHAFKNAYARADFEGAYGQSLHDLVTTWEAQIDARALSQRERRIATERFRRPSIFSRPCAHEVAQLRKRAAAAHPSEAAAIYRQICDHVGNTPASRIDLALALHRAREFDGFIGETDAILKDDRLNSVQRVRLLEERTNVLWMRGELEAARADATSALEIGRSPASERLNWVKLWAMEQDAELRDVLRRFLTREMDPVAAVVAMRDAMLSLPQDRTLPYLIARQLFRVESWEQGLDLLAGSVDHPFAPIEAERLRLKAVALWRLERYADAEVAFNAYADGAPTSGERARALDFVERLRWRRRAENE